MALKSPKSRLQEYTQRHRRAARRTGSLEATGPDHEKTFRVEVQVDGQPLGVGEGPSRRVGRDRRRGRGRSSTCAPQLRAEAVGE